MSTAIDHGAARELLEAGMRIMRRGGELDATVLITLAATAQVMLEDLTEQLLEVAVQRARTLRTSPAELLKNALDEAHDQVRELPSWRRP